VGDLDRGVEEQIASLSADRIEQLGEALLDFNLPTGLDASLQSRG
jgi:hypothetical protein